MEKTLKNISFPIQITTLITVVIFCAGTAVTASILYSDINLRLTQIENFVEEGERWTDEDGQRLEEKIDLKLNRIEDKLDQIIFSKNSS